LSHVRHPAVIAAALLFSAGVLAGCSSSPHHPSSQSKGTTSTGSSQSSVPSSSVPSGKGSKTQNTGTLPNGSIPSNTTTTVPLTGAAVGPTCQHSQLSVSMPSRGTYKTWDVGVFDVTNTSGSRCSLDGYPSLLIFGSLGPLANTIVQGNVAGDAQLTQGAASLSPHGGQATFAASWTYPTPGGKPCPDGTGVDVTLPGVTGTNTVSTDITACGGTINVSPMQPNVVTTH